jgi:hypothetical protein
MARNDSFRGNFAEWKSLFGSSLFSVGKMEGIEKNVEISRNGCVAMAGPANSGKETDDEFCH